MRRACRRRAGGSEKTAGTPSGVFVDAAQELVGKAVPQPLPKERDAAFLQAQQILLRYGVTAVADMGTSGEDCAGVSPAR